MHLFHKKTLNYDYITDGIFIGTNQCCTMGLSNMLKREGVTAEISLEEERLDQPFGVEEYVWIPVRNNTPPSSDQLSFGVSVLEKLVTQKKKVFVHCRNGHGRAPTLVSAYLIKKGMSPKEAVEFVKSKRPVVHLEDSQMLALENYAGSL